MPGEVTETAAETPAAAKPVVGIIYPPPEVRSILRLRLFFFLLQSISVFLSSVFLCNAKWQGKSVWDLFKSFTCVSPDIVDKTANFVARNGKLHIESSRSQATKCRCRICWWYEMHVEHLFFPFPSIPSHMILLLCVSFRTWVWSPNSTQWASERQVQLLNTGGSVPCILPTQSEGNSWRARRYVIGVFLYGREVCRLVENRPVGVASYLKTLS